LANKYRKHHSEKEKPYGLINEDSMKKVIAERINVARKAKNRKQRDSQKPANGEAEPKKTGLGSLMAILKAQKEEQDS